MLYEEEALRKSPEKIVQGAKGCCSGFKKLTRKDVSQPTTTFPLFPFLMSSFLLHEGNNKSTNEIDSSSIRAKRDCCHRENSRALKIVIP
uniref:Ovule protein n=1 Tax=Ascaris lumbricoides TaxID=6252 RepID=A0A0M3HWV7_ASCLU